MARSRQTLLWIILAVGMLLMAIKFIAWWITGSNVILSDAAESIINVLAGAFALYSVSLALIPADENHPYGHGKVEFISATVEGAMILIAGLGIIGKSVYNLFEPLSIDQLDMGILLSGVTGVVNFVLGTVAVRSGKRHRSHLVISSGEHLRADAWSTLGLIVGLFVIHLTGILWLDNAIAIAFSFIVIWTGFRVIRNSVAGLMDEADPDLIRELIEYIQSKRRPAWVDIHDFRVIKYGSAIHIDCHLTLPFYYPLENAHDEMLILEELITGFHQDVEMYGHSDPCIPDSCGLCELADCPERSHPFVKRLDWTVENVTQDMRHRYVSQ